MKATAWPQINIFIISYILFYFYLIFVFIFSFLSYPTFYFSMHNKWDSNRPGRIAVQTINLVQQCELHDSFFFASTEREVNGHLANAIFAYFIKTILT